MSIQIIPASLGKTEYLTAMKNELPESEIAAEIGIDDILDSSDSQMIPDVKDIDIIYHPLCEDSIKRETILENILESKYSESLETQVLVKTENAPLVKIENITESENLNKTSWKKDKEKIKVIEAPVIAVEPHEYTSLAKDKHICNHCQQACKKLNNLKIHIRSKHRKVTTMYQCPYCPHKSKWSVREHIIRKHKNTKDIQWFQCHLCEKKFKLKCGLNQHMKVHLTHEQLQDSNKIEFCPVCGKGFTRISSAKRHMRFIHNKKEMNKGYHCDNCNYKTDHHHCLKMHKLIHLKPEEIQYFYCYHCSYKSIRKMNLKAHIFKHFKNGDITFHCYICDFMTLKRELVIDHIKRHSKVQIKYEINQGN